MAIEQPAGSRPLGTQGGGDDSYANSSSLQNFLFQEYARPHLSQALAHLCTSLLQSLHLADVEQDHGSAGAAAAALPPRLVIADLGCSHGRNTLDYAAFILQRLRDSFCTKLGSSSTFSLEIQYIFSDLPANNFNSLFQSLPAFLEEIGGDMINQPASPTSIFTGAVAGSFHGPLFPTRSLHFAVSALSLHWLSQVPPEVLDRSSPAWNGGCVWLHGQRPKVIEAFAAQHERDMRGFLQNRARELVKGGMLFLLLPCRAELHPSGTLATDPHFDLFTGFFQSTWTQMSAEGLISEEERDMFNIPFYMCHKSELHKLLKEFVGVFEIVKIEVMANCLGMPKEKGKKLLEDPQAFGKFWANLLGSVMRPLMETHLGIARASEFFKRLEVHIMERTRESTYWRRHFLVAIIQRV